MGGCQGSVGNAESGGVISEVNRPSSGHGDVVRFTQARSGDAASSTPRWGGRPKSVLRYAKIAGQNLQHPTEKPVELMTELVQHLAPEYGHVLDPCMGSRPTGIAAVRLGRRPSHRVRRTRSGPVAVC